jgi:nitrogen fixation NifU-like protein
MMDDKIDEQNYDPFDELEDKITKQMESSYSKKTLEYIKNPKNVGRMNDPDGGAIEKGICGDTLEIYLVIKNNMIVEARFYTDGCGVTLACGSALTEFAKGKSINETLGISPKNIIDKLEGLPEEHIHCAILSTNTLHKALADYLLNRQYESRYY